MSSEKCILVTAPVPVAVKDKMCPEQTADRELWQPAIVAECAVPWDVIKRIPGQKVQTQMRTPNKKRGYQPYQRSGSPSYWNEMCEESLDGDIDEFLEPWDVYCDKQAHETSGPPLFKIRFEFLPSTNEIKVTLQQKAFSERLKTDLMVKSCVMWTKRTDPVNPDPLLWPLPEEKRVTHIILLNEKCYPDVVLLNEPCSKTCCFSLRLQVFTSKKSSGDSVTTSLNLARKTSSPFCDIQLQVDGEVFAAHKAVLCARSSVFTTMFTADFIEKLSNCVTIGAVSKEAFGKFLDFLYIEDIDSWDGCELELLDLAERYQVPALKAQCEMALWVVDGPRALSILMEAEKWPILSADFKSRLFRLVMSNVRAVVESREWKTLQSTNPMASGMIQASAAIVEPTVKVFQSAYRSLVKF